MLPIKLNIKNEFYLDEIRSDFLVTSEKKKLWAVLLDLLNEFSSVCQANGIQWFADGGTILGAVRHGGFIPRDDDIDIMMTRENYDKLCEIAPFAFKSPYFFQTEITDPGSLRLHAQLRNSLTTGILSSEKDKMYSFNQGIFIDIFPLDNLPDELGERRRFLRKIKRLRKYLFLIASSTTRYRSKNKGFKSIIKSIIHLIYGFSPKKEVNLYKKYEILEKQFAGRKTKFVAKLFQFPLAEKRIWESKWVETISYLQFEMLRIPVPSCYEEILNKFYGNWKVYKINSSTHGGIFFDTDKSYLNYIDKSNNK